MTDSFDITFDGESAVVDNNLDGYKGRLPLNARMSHPISLMLTDNATEVVVTVTKRDGIIIVKVFSNAEQMVRLETNCPVGNNSNSSQMCDAKTEPSPEELGL